MNKPQGSVAKFLRVITSIFIILYICGVLIYLSPASAFRNQANSLVSPVFCFVGFDQCWTLFAPEIRALNYHVICYVTYENGTTTCWIPPRIELMDQWQKYRKDKMRKWGIDSLPWSDYKPFWPDFARYVGRIHFSENNRPVSVLMLRYTATVPPPDKAVSLNQLKEHSDCSAAFFYRFNRDDLP